jgi:DNA-binding MarR family transcriptional regulator
MSEKPTKETIDAWILLNRTHRRLLESVEKALKENGLPSLDWYDVLLELHREKRSGLRQYQIGEQVLLNKHNLSRLIDRLEQNRLVGRYVCEEDGRGNRIHITEAGEAMLKKMWPVYSQAIQQNFGDKLTASETVELTHMLSKVLVSGEEG